MASPSLARWNLPDSADGTVKRINIILRELRWIYRLNMIQNRFQVRCFACATATVTSIFSELQTRLKIFGICDMQLCTEIASFYLSVPHHIIPFINPYIMYPNLSRPVARQCSLAVASLTWVGLHAFHRAALRPIGHTCCVKTCSMITMLLWQWFTFVKHSFNNDLTRHQETHSNITTYVKLTPCKGIPAKSIKAAKNNSATLNHSTTNTVARVSTQWHVKVGETLE